MGSMSSSLCREFAGEVNQMKPKTEYKTEAERDFHFHQNRLRQAQRRNKLPQTIAVSVATVAVFIGFFYGFFLVIVWLNTPSLSRPFSASYAGDECRSELGNGSDPKVRDRLYDRMDKAGHYDEFRSRIDEIKRDIENGNDAAARIDERHLAEKMNDWCSD
jgi:hypothetical protein